MLIVVCIYRNILLPTDEINRSTFKRSLQAVVATTDLAIDSLPILTAGDTFIERFHAGLDKAGKYSIKIDLLAAPTYYFVTQLFTQQQ